MQKGLRVRGKVYAITLQTSRVYRIYRVYHV